jgi:hypothetical protein
MRQLEKLAIFGKNLILLKIFVTNSTSEVIITKIFAKMKMFYSAKILAKTKKGIFVSVLPMTCLTPTGSA